jgi:hypothetical protein
VWLRAMLDWLPDPGPGRMIVPDYKSTADVGQPRRLRPRHGGLTATTGKRPGTSTSMRRLGLADDDARFVFIVQSKKAPYLVSVIEPDADAMEVGREENRAAIALYAQCVSTGTWPGYGDAVTSASLPPWYTPRLPRNI